MKQRLNKAKTIAKNAANIAGKGAQKAACATGKAIKKSAKVTCHATRVGGKIVAAAVLGSEAEKLLSIEAHDIERDIELSLGEGSTVSSNTSGGRDGYSIPDKDVLKFMRAVGNAVWRLERRMIDEETKEPKDEFSKVWRPISAIKDALVDIGIEVIDMTGHRYDEGLPLKVVAEEKRSGLKEPDICEMLSPVIRFRKQTMIQQGEVVVGRPGEDK